MTPTLTLLLAASIGWASDGNVDQAWQTAVSSTVTVLAVDADVPLSPEKEFSADGVPPSLFRGAIERIVGHFHEPGIRARIAYDPALPWFRDQP